MPMSTSELVKRVREAGLRAFSRRKLERWATLGVVPRLHPRKRRKGRGRGKGWTESQWPGEAFWISLFVEDAFTWMKGRRFIDAVLWAWLRGAPVGLRVVRRYLEASYQEERLRLERRLERQRRPDDEEVHDAIDRLAQAFAYQNPTLRMMKVPFQVRHLAMQQVLAQLAAEPLPDTARSATANYERAWEAILGGLGLAWGTRPKEVAAQHRFFSYRNLESLARTLQQRQLLAAREVFVANFYGAFMALERPQSQGDVAPFDRSSAELTARLYSILFQMPPAWVTALFLYTVLRGGRGK